MASPVRGRLETTIRGGAAPEQRTQGTQRLEANKSRGEGGGVGGGRRVGVYPPWALLASRQHTTPSVAALPAAAPPSCLLLPWARSQCLHWPRHSFRLLLAPPRYTCLGNWGQPSGASLCLFAPLGSSCSPRFPDPALRSPAQRDGGLTCIVCWLEGLSSPSPWARRDLPCQGERVPGVQEKVTRRGILPGFVAFAPGSLLTAPPGPTVHPFPHRGELKKVGKGH